MRPDKVDVVYHAECHPVIASGADIAELNVGRFPEIGPAKTATID
jgi:hypothetical protein